MVKHLKSWRKVKGILLDNFAYGYAVAAMFTSDEREVGGEYDESRISLISRSTLIAMVKECEEFNNLHSDLIVQAITENAAYDLERAGNDFWYSRNGHGTGFWDRGLGSIGDKLHEATKQCEGTYLYRSGKLYTY